MITQNFNIGRLVTKKTKQKKPQKTKQKKTPNACYGCEKLLWAKDCPYRTKIVKTAKNSDIRTQSIETEK